MAGFLPEPYVPNVSDWTKSALQGYQLGNAMQQRNLLTEAGGQAATGNMAGAKSTLYGGGNFEAAQGMETHAAALQKATRDASDAQLTRALKVQEALANVTSGIETPDQFEAVKATLTKAGLPVGHYTFADLPGLKAQTMGTKERLQMALEERKVSALEAGARQNYIQTPHGVFDVNTKTYIAPPAGAASEYGMTPVYGKDAEGKGVVLQLGKSGKAVRTEIPEGISISGGVTSVDTGTGTLLVDKRTGQPLTTVSKDIAEREKQKAFGTETGKAQANLPSALNSAEMMLSTLDKLEKDPYLEKTTGYQAYLPDVTPQAQRVLGFRKQVEGQVFLAAFEKLRGGGQITETEGEKATAAMSRLRAAQTYADYKEALQDCRQEIVKLYDLAQEKAGIPPEKRKRYGGGAVADLSQDKTGEGYAKLPSGARFIAPDGQERIKP